jgi:hypothetical protein
MTPDEIIVHRFKNKMRQHSILIDKIHDVQSDIEEQLERIARSLPPDKSPPDGGPGTQGTRPSSDLEVWESPSGKLTFSFNMQTPFYLPRRLGKALLFLATAPVEDTPNGPRLVGYRRRTEIQAHLQKSARPGITIRLRYVNNVTSLLTAALLENTHRDLIRIDKESGDVGLLLKVGGLRGLESTSAHKWL